MSMRDAQKALMPDNSGEEKCAPRHSWGPGVRPHYLIHYVISGKGVFCCGSHKYAVQQGQIFVIVPGTVVQYQADESDPWHYAWVSFYGDKFKEVMAQTGISLNDPVLTMQNGDELVEALRAMPTERSADLHSNLVFSAKLYEFMSLIVDNKDSREKSENVYLTTARRYIKAHYFEDITVDQVADHIGISRKYLFAIFKNSLNISPKDYIIDYRLGRAKEFLRDEKLAVGNVAYSVGYKDPLTFSKMFRLKVGMSPTEYRKALRLGKK